MEMKYLVEQDTGNIYLPAVHVNGIVGLDASGTSEAKVTNIVYANDTDKINMDLDIAEFDKVVFASLEVEFTHTETESDSAYNMLLNGGVYQIEIDTTNLSSVIPMLFSCIAYDDTGAISGEVEVYARYTNGLLSLRAALFKNSYSVSDIGVVTKEEIPLGLSKIVGCANGIVIGGGN